MSAYAEAAKAVTSTEPQRAGPTMCCADGCPMPGSLADSTNGSADWWCSLHHGAAYGEHNGITARIRNRRPLLVLAARLSNADAGHKVPREVSDWLRKQGRDDLAQAASGRTARELGATMRRVLHDECRAPQQSLPAEKPKEGKESWMNVARLLDGLV